jgi:bifunctional non-homologous end joining protein LigD
VRNRTIFSKNGADFTRRFPGVAAAVRALPVRSCVLDGELIAAGANGQPDFLALLHARRVPVCVYAFDLMELQGRDLRDQPLEQRRARLEALLARGKSDLVRFSESFPDANALLAECVRLGLEGIVCKRKDSVYRSGPRSGWIKVKTSEWMAANKFRARLFERGKARELACPTTSARRLGSTLRAGKFNR